MTALIVQDFLGGKLLCGEIGGVEHYWNSLPDRGEVDLTRHQFSDATISRAPSEAARERVLSYPDTQRRYQRLLEIVREELGNEKASNAAWIPRGPRRRPLSSPLTSHRFLQSVNSNPASQQSQNRHPNDRPETDSSLSNRNRRQLLGGKQDAQDGR